MTTESGRSAEATGTTRRILAAGGLAIALAIALVAVAGTSPLNAAAKTGERVAAPSIEPWALPAAAGTQPDLVAAPDGTLLLSWVEGEDARRELRFARYAGGRWSAPRTIARGDWFGNAMDTPHLRQTADGVLWASWMRKTPAGGHARDIVLSRSANGGRAWSAPVPVNTDGTATEHGFVSLWPASRTSIGVAWLDGRATAKNAAGDGMTMVRSARFDAGLRRSHEQMADGSACDCCSTDMAVVDGKPLLVYRDRGPGEIRDISVRHLASGHWSAPRTVHQDGWVMPACPMNGPSVSAAGRDVAVGWYTAAADHPTVRVALSSDAGGKFGRTLDLDSGPDVLGRVDTTIDAGAAWAAWLREDKGATALWLASAPVVGARVQWKGRVAEVAGRGPGLATPRLVSTGGTVYVAWTDGTAAEPRLHGRRIVQR